MLGQQSRESLRLLATRIPSIFNLQKLQRSQSTMMSVLSAFKYVFFVLLLINFRSLPFAWHSEYTFIFTGDVYQTQWLL